MKFNPFKEKPVDIESTIQDWSKLYEKAYDKNEVDPYTRTRIILMNGTEFESVWFMHQFSRNCNNNDLRRQIALVRRIEQQQQKKIGSLKPLDESILEQTIGYEQLAVDLTAALAQMMKDEYSRKSFDFALLEDFDHLYRYADLLEMEHGIKAEKLVGKYTEIMPARPTIAHHRHPFDSIKQHICAESADPMTKLAVNIITAAEQQTMNYYMNIAPFYTSDIGRKLYSEIGMIEEQHVTQYGSLKDTECSWLENLLMHEYTECYLYYSCYESETDDNVRKVWEYSLMQEIAHLHKAAELLKEYEKKEWQLVIPQGEFPKPLVLKENIDYVRNVIENSITMTADGDDFSELCELPETAKFYSYQNKVNPNVDIVASHLIIDQYIDQNGKDYRFQVAEHPIEALRNRKCDNTAIARVVDEK